MGAALHAPAPTRYGLLFPAAVVLGAVGIVVGVTLGVGITVGDPGVVDKIFSSISTAFVGVTLLLLLYVCWWRKLEVYFSSFPWLAHGRQLQATPQSRVYQTSCPFTGVSGGGWACWAD